jgi:hypothetical protein
MCKASNIYENVFPPSVIVTPMYGTFITEYIMEDRLHDYNAFHLICRFGKSNDSTQAINILESKYRSWFAGVIWDIVGDIITRRNRYVSIFNIVKN